jgi:hypothetical protein
VTSRTIERWVRASWAAATFVPEPIMAVYIQGLGRLDVSLAAGDEFFLADFEKHKTSVSEGMALNERFTLSHLWVLGAYEVVRTICQRIKVRKGEIPKEVAESFEKLKHEFTRLRVPLAKMEPSGAHKRTDSNIAFPTLHATKGISWQVSRDVFITRQDLAESLLTALERTRSKSEKFDGVSERGEFE